MKWIEIYQNNITKEVKVTYEDWGEKLREESDNVLENVRLITTNVSDEVFEIIRSGDEWEKEVRKLIK